MSQTKKNALKKGERKWNQRLSRFIIIIIIFLKISLTTIMIQLEAQPIINNASEMRIQSNQIHQIEKKNNLQFLTIQSSRKRK